jgi:FkbM family methyltransferase
MKLIFYPVFKDQESLSDHYYRLHWYLYPLRDRIDEIVMLRASEDIGPGEPPRYLDSELTALVGSLPISLQTISRSSQLKKFIRTSDLALLWSVDPKAPPRPVPALEGKTAIKIDPQHVRHAGSFYLKLHEQFEGLQQDCAERSARIFERISKRCTSKIGYIFGTGPGLAEADDHDFSDGMCIACNSMVRNDELLERIKPPLIVVADPIFHAGPSSYAAEFRKELVKALDRYDADLIVPMRDYHIYRNHLPERFAERIAAIPFEQGDEPNLDLRRSLHVTSTSNVLTLFLLPLAATLFEEIRILGCDGRPLSANTYFWSHDKKSQFNDKMGDIQKAHPAFFAIDYDDYYHTHCKTLEVWLDAAEGAGRSIKNCTPSHIPALLKRSIPGVGRPDEPAVAPDVAEDAGADIQELIVLDPDALNDFGHYLSYDDRLKVACDSRGLANIIFGSTRCEEPFVRDRPHLRRVLSEHSWKVRGEQADGPHTRKFAEELRSALDLRRQEKGKQGARLYMYCGSLPHAAAVDEVLKGFPEVSACINLFWSTFEPYEKESFVEYWKPVAETLFRSPRVRITAPTRKSADNLGHALGVPLAVAPHPSVAFGDAEATALVDGRDQLKTESPTVVIFPVGMRQDKGFCDTVEAVNKISRASNGITCVVRARQQPNTPAEMVELKKGLQAIDGCELRDESMSDEEFADFLASGDIVVLPYHAPDFAERTSGLVIDAMILGKPVVAYQGTWLGDTLQHFDTGVAVPHRDTSALCDAVLALSANLQDSRRRAREAGRRYFQTNSWSCLLDSVLADCTTVIDQQNRSSDTSKIFSGLYFERVERAGVDETKVVAQLAGADRGEEHIMLDVGAHIGTSASYFAELGWSIYCFEPDADNRAKLKERFRNASNVVIDPRAVGEFSEEGRAFFVSEESTGIGTLHAFRDTHHEASVVDVTTVADIAKQHELDHIDFLKIDVEGLDFAVLKGVPWGKIKPAVIECEFEDAKTLPLGHSYIDMADYLVDKGYTVYVSEWHPIVRYGAVHDWCRLTRYPTELRTPDAWGNLLAFQKDPGMEAVSAAFANCLRYDNHSADQGRGARYSTLAGAIRARSHVLYRIGQFGAFAARSLWRRGWIAVSLLAAILLPFALAFTVAEAAYRWWLLALGAMLAFALLVALCISFVDHLLMRVVRQFVARESELKRRVDSLEELLASSSQSGQKVIERPVSEDER